MMHRRIQKGAPDTRNEGKRERKKSRSDSTIVLVVQTLAHREPLPELTARLPGVAVPSPPCPSQSSLRPVTAPPCPGLQLSPPSPCHPILRR